MMTQRDPDTTRRTILDAAQKVFHEQGFQSASLKDVLDQTGLTKGALYHHFPNKMALGYAVVEEVLEEIVEDMWLAPLRKAANPIDSFLDQLRTILAMMQDRDHVIGCPVNNLALEMSTQDEGFRERINHIYHRWREGLAQALRRGQQLGLVRMDIDPMEAATLTVASLAGGRSLAKCAQEGELLNECCRGLTHYWESLRA